MIHSMEHTQIDQAMTDVRAWANYGCDSSKPPH